MAKKYYVASFDGSKIYNIVEFKLEQEAMNWVRHAPNHRRLIDPNQIKAYKKKMAKDCDNIAFAG